jgi:hypothetical protein
VLAAGADLGAAPIIKGVISGVGPFNFGVVAHDWLTTLMFSILYATSWPNFPPASMRSGSTTWHPALRGNLLLEEQINNVSHGRRAVGTQSL